MIEVAAAGICGTDLHIYHNQYKHNAPVILGHEFSGVVKEITPGVDSIQVGDRVVSLTAAKTCGKCDYCAAGLLMLCDQRLSLGSGVNGAFARYLTVDARLVLKLPDAVYLESAALTEPLACAVNGVLETGAVSAGDVVLILGPGAIGLLSAQVAKAQGGIVVVCGIGRDQERLDMAKKLGADFIINVEQENPARIIMDLTDGYGADVVIECAGAGGSANEGLQLIRKRGRYVQMGLYGRKIGFDIDQLVYKELKFSSIFGTTRPAWKRSLRLLEHGMVQTLPLITAKLPLERWREGFSMLEKKQGVKTLLIPSD